MRIFEGRRSLKGGAAEINQIESEMDDNFNFIWKSLFLAEFAILSFIKNRQIQELKWKKTQIIQPVNSA